MSKKDYTNKTLKNFLIIKNLAMKPCKYEPICSKDKFARCYNEIEEFCNVPDNRQNCRNYQSLETLKHLTKKRLDNLLKLLEEKPIKLQKTLFSRIASIFL